MKNTIQTKRKTKTGFRKLHARTTNKRRKLRASTAFADPYMDMESEVPGVGPRRAFIVIIALHLVALGAFYAHSKFYENEPEGSSGKNETTAAIAATASKSLADPASKLQVPSPEEETKERCIVATGDNYARIAQRKNVDETALRALNGNRALHPGDMLDLPPRLSSRPVDVLRSPKPKLRRKMAVIKESAKAEPAHAIVVEEDSNSQRTVSKTKSRVRTLSDSGKRYTVKSGDTVWRIAHNHKVSSKALLKINKIKDASKLRIGTVLIIPGS